MVVERDPELQILFANADQDLSDTSFTEQVMAKSERLRRVRIARRVATVLVVIILAALFAAPLQDFVLLVSRGLTAPLVQGGDGWLTQVIVPVNNVAGLVALCLLGLQFFLRRIFS